MRWWWLIALVLILIGLSPVFGLALMSLLAWIGDCSIHEGFAQTCMIAGSDWGETLYALGVGGWMFFLTAPIALAGLALALVLAVIALVRRARD